MKWLGKAKTLPLIALCVQLAKIILGAASAQRVFLLPSKGQICSVASTTKGVINALIVGE